MIPIIYEKDETQFTSNGLGRLRDCISCIVTEERNGIYECDFEYPISGANYDLIQCGRIIAVTHDETDDIQPFDIVSFSRPINGVVTFHAVHISYRQSKLTASGTNVSSLADALALLATAKPSNPFSYWTNKSSDALFSAADGVPRSVKQMLGGTEGSILDCYGGEYEWDKWTVRLWSSRGRARDFTIRYGVNLMNYDEEVDYSNTYTACVPFWVGSGENNNNIVVTGNMVSSGIVPYDGREACVPLDLTDKFETQPTAAQLEALASSIMSDEKVFIPAQTIKVEFVRLQDSPDYENYASLMECRLCDSVNVMFPDYDVSGNFKIVKTIYNVLKERFDEMELGTLSVTLSTALDTSGTSPSVSDVTIIKAAAEAQNSANIANGILISMDEAARAANTTLEGIYADAEASKNLLSDMEDAAAAAQTTLTGIYADAETAKTQAASALTSAQSAQASADSALVSLANVEDVVGVLEWITAHGTMTANGSAALDPSKVYFVRDNNGDYHVGSYYYSIVAEPKAEDRTSYYTLSVDESVQNYVAMHLVVDAEGLWLIPDSGGNKVLIATGAGTSYTTAGTYIIGKVNGVDTVFAKFTTDGITMNATTSVQIAHLGYGEGTAQSGTSNAPYYTLGERSLQYTNYSSSSTYSVGSLVKYNNKYYVCKTAITTAEAWNSAHWQPVIGNYSVAENYFTVASGASSHAEGGNYGGPSYPKAVGYASHAEGGATVAGGSYSHAEGAGTKALGSSSHAGGAETIAGYDNQTAIGKYNNNKSTSLFEIGNGTAYNARSNAFEVDSSGNVNIPSGATYKVNGAALLDKYTRSSAGDLGWTNQTDGDAKVIAKSALAYWNGRYNGSNSNLKYCVDGTILGTSTVKDYVIAQSQSTTAYGDGYWRWREWNSGKVEIWYHGSLTLDTSENDSNGVKRHSRWFNLPNSYSLYRCTCIVTGMDTGGWYGCGGVRDSSETTNAEPTRAFQVMGYRITQQPVTTPSNLNIYICGQKTV